MKLVFILLFSFYSSSARSGRTVQGPFVESLCPGTRFNAPGGSILAGHRSGQNHGRENDEEVCWFHFREKRHKKSFL